MNNPLSSLLATTTSTTDIWWLLLYVAVLTFTIHTIVVMYHWFTFGTERKVPLIATAVYVGVGGVILTSSLGLILLTQ